MEEEEEDGHRSHLATAAWTEKAKKGAGRTHPESPHVMRGDGSEKYRL